MRHARKPDTLRTIYVLERRRKNAAEGEVGWRWEPYEGYQHPSLGVVLCYFDGELKRIGDQWELQIARYEYRGIEVG